MGHASCSAPWLNHWIWWARRATRPPLFTNSSPLFPTTAVPMGCCRPFFCPAHGPQPMGRSPWLQPMGHHCCLSSSWPGRVATRSGGKAARNAAGGGNSWGRGQHAGARTGADWVCRAGAGRACRAAGQVRAGRCQTAARGGGASRCRSDQGCFGSFAPVGMQSSPLGHCAGICNRAHAFCRIPHCCRSKCFPSPRPRGVALPTGQHRFRRGPPAALPTGDQAMAPKVTIGKEKAVAKKGRWEGQGQGGWACASCGCP
jgi:hypothetical protein